MPRRSKRSGSYKSRSVRTQSGVKSQRRRKRPGKALCVCGRPLNSAPNRSKASSKTSRRSNRPFGGSLCPVCARKKSLELARSTG